MGNNPGTAAVPQQRVEANPVFARVERAPRTISQSNLQPFDSPALTRPAAGGSAANSEEEFKKLHRPIWRSSLAALSKQNLSDEQAITCFLALFAEIENPDTPPHWLQKGVPDVMRAGWKYIRRGRSMGEFINFITRAWRTHPEMRRLAYDLGCVQLVSTARQIHYSETPEVVAKADIFLELVDNTPSDALNVDAGRIWLATHANHGGLTKLPPGPTAADMSLTVAVLEACDFTGLGRHNLTQVNPNPFCRVKCGTPPVVKMETAVVKNTDYAVWNELGTIRPLEGPSVGATLTFEILSKHRLHADMPFGSATLPWPSFQGKYEGWLRIYSPTGSPVCRLNIILATGTSLTMIGGAVPRPIGPAAGEEADAPPVLPNTPTPYSATPLNTGFLPETLAGSSALHRLSISMDAPPDVEDRGVRVEVRPGRTLNVVHWPALAATTTVFFFHGVGGCADQWEAQMKFFRMRGCTVVAIDMYGHGESDRPVIPKGSANYYHFTELAADALSIFDRYRGDAPHTNIVVGHSYGTSFTLFLADKRESLVAKVINISGGEATDLEPSSIRVPTVILDMTKAVLIRQGKKKAFDQHATRAVIEKARFDTPMFVLKNIFSGMQWEEGEAAARRVTCPVLLLCGLNDAFIAPEEMRVMQRTLADAHLYFVRRASHMVMMEQPDEVNNHMWNFLVKETPVHRSTSSSSIAEDGAGAAPVAVEPLAMNRWSVIDAVGAVPKPRLGHTATLVEASKGPAVVVYGGASAADPTGQRELFDDTWMFWLETRSWQKLEITGPKARHFHSSCAHQNSVYVFGGRAQSYMNDLWVLGPDQGAWMPCDSKTKGPRNRFGHSMVAHDCFLYVFGGYDSDGSLCNDLYRFNTATSDWQRLQTHGTPAEERFHAGVAEIDGTLYIMGGMRNVQPVLNLCHLQSRTWANIDTPAARNVWPNSQNSRSGMVTLVRDRSLLLFGGGQDAAVFSDLWMFNIDEDKWHRVRATKPPIARTHAAGVVWKGDVYIFFGGDGAANCCATVDVLLLADASVHTEDFTSLQAVVRLAPAHDAVIQCTDGEVSVHACVLAARTPVFWRTATRTEAGTWRLSCDSPNEVVSSLVEYLYGPAGSFMPADARRLAGAQARRLAVSWGVM